MTIGQQDINLKAVIYVKAIKTPQFENLIQLSSGVVIDSWWSVFSSLSITKKDNRIACVVRFRQTKSHDNRHRIVIAKSYAL